MNRHFKRSVRCMVWVLIARTVPDLATGPFRPCPRRSLGWCGSSSTAKRTALRRCGSWRCSSRPARRWFRDMKLTKIDDYQCWFLSLGQVSVLIDPWLTPEMRIAGGLFTRVHQAANPIPSLPERPDYLIVSAHFGDHLHPPSLGGYREVPTFSTKRGAAKLAKLGFRQVHTLRAGDTRCLSNNVSLQIVAPGFPYASSSLGLLFHEQTSNGVRRVYLETHVTDERELARLPKPVHALVSTAESVRLFGIQLSMDEKRAARATLLLGASRFIATGVAPSASTGVLAALLSIRSTPGALQAELVKSGAVAKAHWPQPGETIEI